MSSIFTFLNSFAGRNIVLDNVIIFTAKYFQYVVIFYALYLMYKAFAAEYPEISPFRNLRRAITEGFWVSWSVILAVGVTYYLKYLFEIPRPFLSGATYLFIHGGYNSFPSGHATFFAALALAMFFYHKKQEWVFLIAALLIGLARVMSGVHYPIDIIAGYIIGILSAYFVIKIFRPWFKKRFFGI